jgi:hypothetical protein
MGAFKNLQISLQNGEVSEEELARALNVNLATTRLVQLDTDFEPHQVLKDGNESGRADLTKEAMTTVLTAAVVFLAYATFRGKQTSLSELAKSPTKPPFIGEWLITLVTPSRKADAILGDMEERFQRELAERSLTMARLLYWARVTRSVGPLALTSIKKAGWIAAVAEVFRRFI